MKVNDYKNDCRMFKIFSFLTLTLILSGNTVFAQSTDDYIVIETVGYGKNQNEKELNFS